MYGVYYVDTCTSNEYNGPVYPVVEVPVTVDTTYGEIKKMLLEGNAISHLGYMPDGTEFDYMEYLQGVQRSFADSPLGNVFPSVKPNYFNWDKYEGMVVNAYFVIKVR